VTDQTMDYRDYLIRQQQQDRIRQRFDALFTNDEGRGTQPVPRIFRPGQQHQYARGAHARTGTHEAIRHANQCSVTFTLSMSVAREPSPVASIPAPNISHL
jgi:hypothetical protein